ncbi:hypothetical protein JCM5353_000263 [Sporobolomyces roseus]
MFHISTPFDYSHSSPSPFSHFPSSSVSSSNAFLPPTYASYDEERSRIEQALLARKQQERRQAEAAAFLAEQRRLERQAAIEEAIREERERREYERALMSYREGMVKRAREDESVKQGYMQAIMRQQDMARRQQLEEQQQRRRRNEQAAEQRQIEQSSLDTMPDLLRHLFGGPSPQHDKSSRPTEPVATPQPSNPSPVQTQPSRSEQPQLDLPHFLEAIFGTPQPSTTTKQASPTPQQAPAPVSQSAPSPSAQTSSSPSPSPASPLASVAPSSIPIVHQETPADSPTFDEEEEAATKVQRQFRRHLARRNALDKISSISTSFLDRQSIFEKPSTLTFKSSPDSTSSTTTPSLAFVSSNSPFLAYEDYLVNLLSKIDAVESGGDKVVKQERKSLVRKVEKELSRLDAMKERAWEEQVKAAKSDLMQENEKAKEEVDAAAETKEDPSPESSAPTEATTDNDDDDTLPPLPLLTHDAVSSLPTSTPLSNSRSPSDSGSSTTSSTLTVSSASSQVDQYISEMLRRAQKLGEQVEKMELEEMSKPSEQVVTV